MSCTFEAGVACRSCYRSTAAVVVTPYCKYSKDRYKEFMLQEGPIFIVLVLTLCEVGLSPTIHWSETNQADPSSLRCMCTALSSTESPGSSAFTSSATSVWFTFVSIVHCAEADISSDSTESEHLIRYVRNELIVRRFALRYTFRSKLKPVNRTYGSCREQSRAIRTRSCPYHF